jgi:hypothetical protein
MQEMMKAFRVIAQSYSEQELARLISSGQIERVLETAFNDTQLNAAYAPVRDRIRSGVTDSVRYFVRSDIPVPKTGTIGIAFDSLSPHVIEAIRKLETRVMTDLSTTTREVVRMHLDSGIREGHSPTKIAKGLREILGLSPSELQAVNNYRAELEKGSKRALDRALRNKRDDKAVIDKTLTPDRIDRMVASYQKRMTAHHAETVAKTAALDANKLAQKLAWDKAIADGIVDGSRLQKTWVQVDRPTKRDEHKPLHGETVPYYSPYSNGQMIPGEGDYNCACISRITLRRIA